MWYMCGADIEFSAEAGRLDGFIRVGGVRLVLSPLRRRGRIGL